MSEEGGKLIYGSLSYKINRILFQASNDLGSYCNEQQICDRIEYYLKEGNFLYR